MEIKVEEEVLKKLKINLNAYFILYCIKNKEEEFLLFLLDDGNYIHDFTLLEKKEIIYQMHKSNNITTQYCINVDYAILIPSTGKKIEKEYKARHWVQEFREIFPKGKNSGGYPYRGDKQGCITNLEKFIKNNPEYDKDIILNATKFYVKSKAKDGYDYMQLAHYFIYKNGISSLGAFCEQVKDGGDVIQGNVNNILNL